MSGLRLPTQTNGLLGLEAVIINTNRDMKKSPIDISLPLPFKAGLCLSSHVLRVVHTFHLSRPPIPSQMDHSEVYADARCHLGDWARHLMRGHLKQIWAERACQLEAELIDYLCGCQGLSASQRAGLGGGGLYMGL